MQEQVYAAPDRSYSAWHRRNSTRRFIGIDRAQLLSMVDLDCLLYVEYDDLSKEPLALIETARDVDQPHKPATVVLRLAKKARVPAYLVLYKLADARNPADPRSPDIASFRIRRLWPQPEASWRELTPGREFVSGNGKARRLDHAANDPTF